MASNSLIFNQDLRAAARDYKRDSDNKSKWEHGTAFGPGRLSTSNPRPKKIAYKQKIHKAHAAKGVHRAGIVADRLEAVTDSSSDEEIHDPNSAPSPDAEITYSFDAARGPSHGSKILGLALEKAVEQFENNATERLVNDEYELLDSNGDPVPVKAKKSPRMTANPEDDEEYEFV